MERHSSAAHVSDLSATNSNILPSVPIFRPQGVAHGASLATSIGQIAAHPGARADNHTLQTAPRTAWQTNTAQQRSLVQPQLQPRGPWFQPGLNQRPLGPRGPVVNNHRQYSNLNHATFGSSNLGHYIDCNYNTQGAVPVANSYSNLLQHPQYSLPGAHPGGPHGIQTADQGNQAGTHRPADTDPLTLDRIRRYPGLTEQVNRYLESLGLWNVEPACAGNPLTAGLRLEIRKVGHNIGVVSPRFTSVICRSFLILCT